MGMLYRLDRRMLDLRQRRNHNPEQHHTRARGNEMRELEYEDLDYDLVPNFSDSGDFLWPAIVYRPSKRIVSNDGIQSEPSPALCVMRQLGDE